MDYPTLGGPGLALPYPLPLLQLHLLKERLQELLTGERGAACGGYSGVQDTARIIRTMSLPIGVKEGVTVNSLVSPSAHMS